MRKSLGQEVERVLEKELLFICVAIRETANSSLSVLAVQKEESYTFFWTRKVLICSYMTRVGSVEYISNQKCVTQTHWRLENF